jgi:hypothetical protein
MTPSLTDVQVFTALRAVLLAIVGTGVDVLRGEVNRVPEPLTADFVIMSPRARTRLAMGVETWEGTAPSAIDVETATHVAVQLDVHGPLSADVTAAIVAGLGSSWAADQFAAQDPAVLAPLYTDEAQFLPFVNGEQQTEWRYVIGSHFEARPVLSTPAQFARTLAVTSTQADSGAAA